MPRNPALERNEHRRNFDSTNGLLLIPVVIGLVMLTRWIRGRPVFTDRDWLFLIGRPRGEVFSLHLWFRFAALWLAVVLMGFIEGTFSCPLVSLLFFGAVFSPRLWFGVLRRVATLNRGKPTPERRS